MVLIGYGTKKATPQWLLSVFLKIPPNNKSGGQLLAPTHPASTVVVAEYQVTVQNFVLRTMAQAIVWWSLSFSSFALCVHSVQRN